MQKPRKKSGSYRTESGNFSIRKKDAERKARTHRLIERGAILESLLEKPEQYSNEQIKGLLEVTFQTAQAQEHLRKIGEENREN